ncbi:putative zinc transporter ZIP1, partial [Triplophysa rosa]
AGMHCFKCDGDHVMMDSDQTSPVSVVPELYIRLSALSVVFCVSVVCGFGPLWIMRRRVFFTSDSGSRGLMSSFACGVFLATALLERLPVYLDNTKQTFGRLGVTLRFPLPEFILVMGFLVVLVAEQILLAFRDQSRDLSCEKEALLDSGLQRDAHSYQQSPFMRRRASGTDGSCCPEDVRSHAALRVFFLLFSLCPYAVFEGLTAGAQLGRERLLDICLASVLREGTIAVSLAFRLIHSDLRRTAVAAALLLFSVMSPVGMGLAGVLAEMKPSPQVQLVYSAVEGLTLGIFINVTVVALMWHGPASPKHRIHKVAFLLTGFAVFTGVLFIQT